MVGEIKAFFKYTAGCSAKVVHNGMGINMYVVAGSNNFKFFLDLVCIPL